MSTKGGSGRTTTTKKKIKMEQGRDGRGPAAEGGNSTAEEEVEEGEKGRRREHAEGGGQMEETEHRWEEVEEEEAEEEDEEEDDVVVIDPVSSRYPSLASVVPPPYSASDPANPASTSSANFPSGLPKMDPTPPIGSDPASGKHPQSWFSAASFLPSGADPSSASSDPAMSPQAGAQRLLAELRQRYQPWSVFFSCAKFGCPPGLVAVGPRIRRNLATFTTNYLCLFAVLLLYCVLTSLLMLLTLLVLGGLLYSVYQFTKRGPMLVGAYEIPPSLLYTLALMLSIPFFWLADAGSVMYWVLGSGMFLMLAHSTFYASEEVPGSEFEVVVTA